jgi:hypothetical protein
MKINQKVQLRNGIIDNKTTVLLELKIVRFTFFKMGKCCAAEDKITILMVDYSRNYKVSFRNFYF